MASIATNIVFNSAEEYDLPQENFGIIIWNALKRRNPQDVVYIDAITKESLTCGQILQKSVQLTFILKDLGMQQGDVISVASGNSINCFIPVIAAFYMGIAVNPINPGFTLREIKHCLQLSKPKLIFCVENALQSILEEKKELKYVQRVLLMGPTSRQYANLFHYEDLLLECTTEINGFIPKDYNHKTEVALIVSSSGTTGLPKGVMLTHQNLLTPLHLFSQREYGNTTKDDITILIPPFFQIFGPILYLLTIVTSMKSLVMDKFNAELFLKRIEEYRVTKLYLVPPLVLFLAKSTLVSNYNLSSIKEIFVGAAPLGKELQNEAKERLNGVIIRQIYGLSETCGPCTLQMDKKKTGSVGLLMPGATAKVVNPKTNLPVGPLEKGEICLKGPMLMKGYIPTQYFMDKDGFFKTGDVGYYDHDGYFYVVDRIKDIIKYKGFQVAPTELENLILTHPSVEDCAVIGIFDERAGEVPLAYVVLKGKAHVVEEEIVNYVAERISTQKHLYGGVKFVQEIPKNPAGKIMRRKLVEMFTKMQVH